MIRRIARHPSAAVGSAIVALYVVGVVFAPLLAPHDPDDQDLRLGGRPPLLFGGGWGHPLGTDRLGRDLLSRLLFAGRVSLLVALAAFLVQALVGGSLGLLCGYLGGKLDQFVMRIADVQLALPGLVMLLAAVAVFGPSFRNLVLFLGLSGWPAFARVIRSEVLSIRERDYIEAARAIGARPRRIVGAHVLPNVLTSLAVVATISVPGVILAEASLSFLGLGVPPDVATWGSMANDGRPFLSTAWWMSTLPGLAIVFIVLGINLLGDGLRDLLDPRTRSSRRRPR